MLTLAGCTTPEPTDPTPTPTSAFASEEEAFAAAEATYRAYVDALNEVDLSDPETFEAVYEWTTGELNGSDRKSYSQWHSDGYTKIGDAVVVSIEPQATNLDVEPSEALAHVCLDISAVDIRDGDGASVVAADRPDVQSLEVTFLESDDSVSGLRISSLDPAAAVHGC
ncbi:hypothetical protein B2K11_15245 [Microbacterium sp. B35-30]|nr:hypothetical protein B2K11_15245 [Microbacterium sp. B35-30]